MPCTIKDLFDEYQLDTTGIPFRILNITLEEEVTHFSKGYVDKDIIYFKGAYNPEWTTDKDMVLDVECSVNLKRYTKKLIKASMEFGDGVEPSVELTDEIFTRFISEEVVRFSQTVKDNFTYYCTYSILGNVIKES